MFSNEKVGRCECKEVQACGDEGREEWEVGGRGRELYGAEHSWPAPETDTGFCFHCSEAFLREMSGLLLWVKERNLDTMIG